MLSKLSLLQHMGCSAHVLSLVYWSAAEHSRAGGKSGGTKQHG